MKLVYAALVLVSFVTITSAFADSGIRLPETEQEREILWQVLCRPQGAWVRALDRDIRANAAREHARFRAFLAHPERTITNLQGMFDPALPLNNHKRELYDQTCGYLMEIHDRALRQQCHGNRNEHVQVAKAYDECLPWTNKVKELDKLL